MRIEFRHKAPLGQGGSAVPGASTRARATWPRGTRRCEDVDLAHRGSVPARSREVLEPIAVGTRKAADVRAVLYPIMHIPAIQAEEMRERVPPATHRTHDSTSTTRQMTTTTRTAYQSQKSPSGVWRGRRFMRSPQSFRDVHRYLVAPPMREVAYMKIVTILPAACFCRKHMLNLRSAGGLGG